MADFIVKQGDTFRIEDRLVDRVSGEPIDLDAAQIVVTSAVKTASGRWLPLSVQPLDQADHPGRYDLVPAESTQGWPTGKHSFDAQYVRGAVRWSSDTDSITIIEDVTP